MGEARTGVSGIVCKSSSSAEIPSNNDGDGSSCCLGAGLGGRAGGRGTSLGGRAGGAVLITDGLEVGLVSGV